MNVAVARVPKSIQQDLRRTLPQWMAVFVIVILIQALAAVSPTNPQPWSFLTSVASGLVDGAAGGSIFVVLQRWWNPKDTRVMRLRNYLIAIMFVGVASLFAMTAINT